MTLGIGLLTSFIVKLRQHLFFIPPKFAKTAMEVFAAVDFSHSQSFRNIS